MVSLLDLVLRLEPDGTIGPVTGSPELLLGWSGQALRGRRLAELVEPAHRLTLDRLLAGAGRGESPAAEELRFLHRNGWEVWLEVGVRPLQDGAGFLLGARDVTVRRQGEQALEESRERYRLLFEQSPVGVMHYDTDMRVSDCNESFRRILGSTYEQLLGLDMRKLRDQRMMPALEAALAGHRGLYEGPYDATLSPAHLWVNLRTVPFHNAQGEVQGGICIVEDVTERRQAEVVQRATYEISEAVHATEDLDQLFRSIHAVLARLMPAQNIYFALHDPATDTISFPYFVDSQDSPPAPRRATAGLTETVLRSGEPLLATRGELERLAHSGVGVGAFAESWLGVPLRRGAETIGVLALQSYDPHVAFDERHRQVLGFVADQVAMAIERKRHEEQIEEMAYFDGLTGLYNRRMLQERAQQSLELARRHRWQVAMLYLDLDRFKNVNDTLGHDAGDELLRLVAHELRAWLRASDTLARLGGDEFAFVLNTTDARRASDAAQRILARLDRSFEVRGQPVRIGASIGIATFPEHGDTLEELLKHADIAMYQAKAEGGSFRVFDPGRSPYTRHRLALEAELRQAVGAGELELHYQPLQELASGQLVGFEALARWRRGGVLLAAEEFVPLAEESDLIRLLDWQLLGQALRDARSLLAAHGQLHISINLSARCLHASGLVAYLAGLLAEHGVAAERLVLEVTESATLADSERCCQTLQELTRLGVRLAMDDFGSGFASLTYLRSMPLHRVKIDRSLVGQVGSDRRGEELLRGAIGLCHGLGLEVVGEGVETTAQRDWLRRQGCDLVQGHLIGLPASAADAARLAARPAPARS